MPISSCSYLGPSYLPKSTGLQILRPPSRRPPPPVLNTPEPRGFRRNVGSAEASTNSSPTPYPGRRPPRTVALAFLFSQERHYPLSSPKRVTPFGRAPWHHSPPRVGATAAQEGPLVAISSSTPSPSSAAILSPPWRVIQDQELGRTQVPPRPTSGARERVQGTGFRRVNACRGDATGRIDPNPSFFRKKRKDLEMMVRGRTARAPLSRGRGGGVLSITAHGRMGGEESSRGERRGAGTGGSRVPSPETPPHTHTHSPRPSHSRPFRDSHHPRRKRVCGDS